MAYAICLSCGQEIRWFGGRGQRLADRRCPCGGELKGKTAGRPSASKGQTIRTCVVCKRRSFKLRALAVPITVKVWKPMEGFDGPRRLFGEYVPKEIAAGEIVCFDHARDSIEREPGMSYDQLKARAIACFVRSDTAVNEKET